MGHELTRFIDGKTPEQPIVAIKRFAFFVCTECAYSRVFFFKGRIHQYVLPGVIPARNGRFGSVAAHVSTPRGACWIARHHSFTQHADFCKTIH